MYPQPQRTNVNEITQQIIGAAIAVHRALGSGLLESAYQERLCRELTLRGIPLEDKYLYRSNTAEFSSGVDTA